MIYKIGNVAIILFGVIISVGCERSLKVDDVVVTKKLFSPDSSFVAITYFIDNGALGQSLSRTSIMSTADTLEPIGDHNLPCLDLPLNSCYYANRWIDAKTLEVYLNERPFIRAGVPFDSSGFQLNGVLCKVVPYDYSYGVSPLIEYFSYSKDRSKLLVVYRYGGPSELNVSVINKHEEIPKYGNISTNYEWLFNPIDFVSWNKNSIDMFLKDAHIYEKSNYVNDGIEYKVNFVNSNPLNKPISNLYNDSLISEYLKVNGKKVWAKIIKSQWQKPEGVSQYYYEYEYEVNHHKIRSYFRIYKDFKEGADYGIGDSVSVIYNESQPLIHKTEQNYRR